jgi:hypothetical protein
MGVVTEPDVVDLLERLHLPTPTLKVGLGVSKVSVGIGGVATITLTIQTVPSFAVRMGTTSISVNLFDTRQYHKDGLTTLDMVEAECVHVTNLLKSIAKQILADMEE